MANISKTREYQTWDRMKQRCYNKKRANYKDYGGRGIIVCARWRGSDCFPNFLKDLGKRPSDKHSLDRIEVNGHYSCGKCAECKAKGFVLNVRWAPPKVQQNNTRANVRLTLRGMTLTIAEWSAKTGIHSSVLYYRHQAGWSDKKVLQTAVSSNHNGCMIRFRGISGPILYWSKKTGLSRSVIHHRFYALRWSAKKTLTTDTKQTKSKLK